MKRLLLVILIIFSWKTVYSQNPIYEGTEFYVAFMQNGLKDTPNGYQLSDLDIFISSLNSTKVTIQPANENPIEIDLPANVMYKMDVSSWYELTTDDVENPINKSIYIKSDLPIVVYGVSGVPQTSDGFAALPTSSWGTEYVIISMPNDHYYFYQDDPWKDFRQEIRRSEFMVVAMEDGTEIDFSPEAVTALGKQTFRRYTVTLNKGDCYLVQSSITARGQGDQSGTVILSNKPIGVYSGHVRSSIPQHDQARDTKDHLVEMLYPVDKWGTTYFSVPMTESMDGDYFRVVTREDGNSLQVINDDIAEYINLPSIGHVADLDRVRSPTMWRSEKPIQIAQIMRSHDGSQSNVYDPAMVMLPSTDNFVSRILFQTPGDKPTGNPDIDKFVKHEVYIVAHEDAIIDMSLDDIPIQNFAPGFSNQRINNSTYLWAKFEVDYGTHELKSKTGLFSGVIYGKGVYDSYALTLGTTLTNPFDKDIYYPQYTLQEDCGRLDIAVWDSLFEYSSGLNLLAVIEDSTENYDYEVGPMTDTTYFSWVTAEPKDMKKDAHILIKVWDKNVNMTRIYYEYKAPKISFPDEIIFSNAKQGEKNCIEFSIKNQDTRAFRVEDIRVGYNPKLTLFRNGQVPGDLMPNDSMTFMLCFEPGTDTSAVFSQLTFKLPCDIEYTIPIKARVDDPQIGTIGWDFGDVRVDDTACANVKFYNYGNVDIHILRLIEQFEVPQFEFETKDLVDQWLIVGDTIEVPVCFMPTDSVYYSQEVGAENSYQVSNKAIVTGTGISPIIKTLTIGWGKRWLGTKNDTTVYIHNSGKARGSIKFKEFNSNEDAFDNDYMETITVDLEPNETKPIDLVFNPNDTRRVYAIEGIYEVDCSIHADISIIQQGYSTMPEIRTYDIRFDTVKLSKYTDTSAQVIRVKGVEKLNVFNVEPDSGDLESFIIDYTYLKDFILDPYSDVSDVRHAEIRFFPDRLGDHHAKLRVLSDAAPFGKVDTSYINLYGPAKEDDTLTIDMDFDMPPVITSCKLDTITVSMQNTGNIRLELQKMWLEKGENGDYATNWLNYPEEFPVYFDPEEVLEYSFEILTSFGETGDIEFHAEISDTMHRQITIPVDNLSDTLVIFENEDFVYTPNDTVELAFGGIIKKNYNVPTEFRLNIFIDIYHFLLLNKEHFLELKNINEIVRIPLEVDQFDNRIELRSVEELVINEDTEWSIEMGFFTLYHNFKDSPIRVEAPSDACFEGDESLFFAELSNVCVYDLRKLNLIEFQDFIVDINPNPPSDELNVNVNIAQNMEIVFRIIDPAGQIYYESGKFNLKKGRHSLIFEINSLSNGVYFLQASTPYQNRNIMFIITK